MTAIKEFERLEALGLWRETSDAQRREVVISFGDTTLVLSDINNRPLTHWSLAAIENIGTADSGTIFTVDELGAETLEIEDPTMIMAIGKIRAAIDASRPHPGRLRWYISAITLLLFVGFSLFWLPDALTKYAASIVPQPRAEQIGDALIKAVQKTTGSVCSSPSGTRALQRLEKRVFGTSANRLRIIEMGSRPSFHLPGGNILLNQNLTVQSSEANLLAGYAIMERASQQEETPFLELFNFIGMRKTFGFLGTGSISNTDLNAFADWQLSGPTSDPSPELMMNIFKSANVPFTDFATHSKRPDMLKMQDIPEDSTTPILSDNDWISLQEICAD
tara:strand:+ start:12852 stop:13853 length:1002 start_codon:yes stop_codon:yes gene_type:complete